MVRITSVKPLEGFCVRLTFTDNSMKEVDLSPYLNGPVFKPLRENLELFRPFLMIRCGLRLRLIPAGNSHPDNHCLRSAMPSMLILWTD